MAYRRGLRADIVQSDGTFVVALVAIILMWMMGHWGSISYWGSLGLTVMAGYLLLEMNNRCHMLRVRSRMMSSTFLLLMATLPMYHPLHPALLALPCVAWANLLLFSVYQKREPVGSIFYAFLLWGVGACVCMPLWLVVPVLWLCCGHHLRILTLRTWMASIFGLLVPVIYIFLASLLEWMPLPFSGWMQMQASLPALWTDVWAHLTLPGAVSCGVLMLLYVWSALHFSANAYRDNMRTRMCFNVLRLEFNIVFLSILSMAVLQLPVQTYIPVAVLLGAPSVAHYFTLSEGRWHNFWCWMWAAALIALAVVNYGGLLN